MKLQHRVGSLDRFKEFRQGKKEIEEQERREILERNREARRNKLLREKEEIEKLERNKDEEKETKEESNNQGE